MQKFKFSFSLLCVMIFFISPFCFLAQSKSKLVADSRTKNGIDFVFVQSDNAAIKLVTNKEGRFILVDQPEHKTFVFYKMGYLKKTISAEVLLAMDTIFLEQKQVDLEEVVVRNNKIDTVIKDKRYYVDDYCVLPDNNFLILTSKANTPGFDISFYDKVKGIRFTKHFKDEKDAYLVTDCFKNIHLVTNNCSRQIFFDSESSFEFLSKYSRRIFDSTLAACVLKTDTQVIMKRQIAPSKVNLSYVDAVQNSPFINYFRVSRHARAPFCSIHYNKRMQEMIDNELKDSQMMYADDPDRMEAQIVFFYQNIASPIYGPMFLKNDTIVFFDFQENRITFFDQAGTELKKVGLDKEEFETKRNFEILYDEAVQKFYMKIRTGDRFSIKQIDIYSGKIIKTIKLEKIFARNVQIARDRIYYMVREKEWDDTQYLYYQN